MIHFLFPLRTLAALAVMSLAAVAPSGIAATPPDLRIGMIGLDTSHVIAFTRVLNTPTDKDHVPGARVVAAFKGGSPDVESSRTRIDGFTHELVTKYGVKLYDTIEELARNVDAIMITSVDGRAHLDQARRVLPFRKPVFIDKPLAGSLRDGIEIVRLARQHGVPIFSTSSLRYSPGIAKVKGVDLGRQLGAFSMGPARLEPHHPDLFWYGIHAVEAMYTMMGRGCATVVCSYTPDTHVVTGVWSDGRVGTVRGTRNAKDEYALLVFGAKGTAEHRERSSYPAMLVEVLKFFRTGISPVDPLETIEILAFMEASDESKRRGGAPVALAEVMKAHGAPAEMLK
jgi:predicted dehydrogenase